MKTYQLKQIIREEINKVIKENSISRDIENLIDEMGWNSYEDIENEIEKIRDEFNLTDSNSRYDEAYSKFEEIYHANPIDIKRHMNNKI
jgi:transcription elongation factor